MPRLRLLPPAVEATTPRECAPILEHLMRRGGTIAIDTETTGLKRMSDRVLFWSMATEDARWCFPASMLPVFDPLFQNRDVSWALANAKYDMHLLKNAGYELHGNINCIFVQDCLLDDTRRHGLKEQAKLTYEAQWGDFKELFLDPHVVCDVLGLDSQKAREFREMTGGDKLLYVYDQAPHMVIEYASCDAFFTYMLWEKHRAALAAEELAVDKYPGFQTLLDYFDIIEAPMTKCLFRMERRGVMVDQDYVKKIDLPIREGLAGLGQDLRNISRNKELNPRSPDQVRRVLYDEKYFGLKPAKYTKSTKAVSASTDSRAMEILLDRIQPNSSAARFIVKLLEYRKLDKLHKTYVKGIDKHLGPDGRLHSDIKQHVARTGRFSSGDPNLQNIPRPDPESDPYLIRGAFIPSPGHWLVDQDYPQIEFRVAAVNADEQKMMEAVRKGWDIHNANTVNMFGLEYDEVAAAKAKKKDELTQADHEILSKRQQSKTVGLGTLFGEGARKMAAQLGIDVNNAYRLKDQFFEAYPGIEQNIAYMHVYAEEFGHTFTMLGRKRRLHQINSEKYSRFVVAEEQRQAYNTWIQGSAAELIKLAMLRIDACDVLESLGGRLILTVHDELLMEAPKDTAEDVKEIMKEYMADPMHWGPIEDTYPVPITPDGDIGYRWSECH